MPRRSFFRHNTALALISLTISACQSVQHQGTSTAEGVLRNDITHDIRRIFTIQTHCGSNININQRIVGVLPRNATRPEQITEVQEIWTVRGCGRSINYPIYLRPTDDGGTDYNIRITP